jgi:hypothetical protein
MVSRLPLGNATVGEITATTVCRQNGPASIVARIVGPILTSGAASPPQTTIRLTEFRNQTPQSASALFGLSPSADADRSDKGWVNVWKEIIPTGSESEQGQNQEVKRPNTPGCPWPPGESNPATRRPFRIHGFPGSRYSWGCSWWFEIETDGASECGACLSS